MREKVKICACICHGLIEQLSIRSRSCFPPPIFSPLSYIREIFILIELAKNSKIHPLECVQKLDPPYIIIDIHQKVGSLHQLGLKILPPLRHTVGYKDPLNSRPQSIDLAEVTGQLNFWLDKDLIQVSSFCGKKVSEPNFTMEM